MIQAGLDKKQDPISKITRADRAEGYWSSLTRVESSNPSTDQSH
jgi:hypothetical protein